MPATDNFFASNTRVSGQTDHPSYFRVALPGMLSGMGGIGSYRMLPYVNDIAAVDSWTLTPPVAPGAPTPDTEYTVTVNGVTAKFTSAASGTTSALLMAGLFNKMRSSPLFYSQADVELDKTTNVITLKARSVLTTLLVQLNEGSNIVLAHSATPSASSSVPFGVFVGRKATYKLDQKEGVSQASVIDSATGYEVLGITMQTHHTEKTGIGANATGGYTFGDTMNVMDDTGVIKGIYVRSDADVRIGDTPYIAVGAGVAGTLTKVATGNLNIASKVRISSGAVQSIGNVFITLVQFHR